MTNKTAAPLLLKVTVYMHPEQRKALRLLAAEKGLTMSETVKQLIERFGDKL
jgi:hypothetical protein